MKTADDQRRARHAARLTVAAIAILVGGVIAAATRSTPDAERTVQAGGDGHAVAFELDDSVTEITEPPAAPTTIAAPPATAAPATTMARAPRVVAPSSTTAPTTTIAKAPSSTSGLGTVITISDRGVYAIEALTGHLVRVSDVAPFTVAGSEVLTASATTVSATPVTGGPGRQLYTLTGAEGIDWLEANHDGAAAVRLSTQRRDSEGRLVGAELYNQLVDATGNVVVDELPTMSEVEWSGDGSVLVVHNHHGVRGMRASGEVAWGPVAPPESLMKDVRVSYGGELVTGEFNSHAVRMLEVASGRWRDTAVWRQVSFGPGLRLMGQPTPPPGWSGQDPVGIIVWNPADDSKTPYARSGSEPSWSHDGAHAVLLDEPVTGAFDGSNFSLRLRAADGSPRFTLSAPGFTFGRDANSNNIGRAITGPRWTSDGRFVVVGVY